MSSTLASAGPMRGHLPSAAGRRGALLLLAALLAAPAAAHAQSAPPAAQPGAEEASKKRAQSLFDEGMQRFGDGDYVIALEKFRLAYAEYPSAKILVNIGTTLRQLGRNVEAAETYQSYLRDPRQEPKRAEEVKRSLGELEAVLGRVRLKVSRPGAEVRLDGKVVASSTDEGAMWVEPGEHTFVAELAGFPPALVKVRVGPREERVVELLIVPASQKTVIVSRDAPVSKTQRNIGFVVGGVGLAGVAVGAVFGLIARSKNDEAGHYCLSPTRCDATGASLGDTARTDATVSTVAFAVSGAALATSVVLLLTAPSPKRAAPTRGERGSPATLAWSLGPGGATLGGSW